MENCRIVKTPISIGEDKSFEPSDDLVDKCVYQELIGELLYLSNRTRPDLAFVMSYLSQFNQRPEQRHFQLLKRVLRYLKGTKGKMLFYDNEKYDFKIYADASWGKAEKGKSFSGFVVMVGSSLIAWKSNKQKQVGLSTCEVELFAIAEACRDLTYFLNVFRELNNSMFDFILNRSVIVYSDNQAAINWLKEAHSSTKTRHVNLKFHFVRDMILSNTIAIDYIRTDDMIADFLTKALSPEKIVFNMKSVNLI